MTEVSWINIGISKSGTENGLIRRVRAVFERALSAVAQTSTTCGSADSPLLLWKQYMMFEVRIALCLFLGLGHNPLSGRRITSPEGRNDPFIDVLCRQTEKSLHLINWMSFFFREGKEEQNQGKDVRRFGIVQFSHVPGVKWVNWIESNWSLSTQDLYLDVVTLVPGMIDKSLDLMTEKEVRMRTLREEVQMVREQKALSSNAESESPAPSHAATLVPGINL